MDRLEVFKIIALQASKGELTFPANVKATLKLQEALDDPDCHIEAAAAWSWPSRCCRRGSGLGQLRRLQPFRQ